MAKTKIKIISIPPGAAPKEIREDWVGIEIPLAEQQPDEEVLLRETTDIGGGKPPAAEVNGGYVVNTLDAIQALDKAGKKRAANWWRKWVEINSPLTLYSQLVFSVGCCQVVNNGLGEN